MASCRAVTGPLIESEQINPEFTAEARRITGESLYALGSETEALKLLRRQQKAMR